MFGYLCFLTFIMLGYSNIFFCFEKNLYCFFDIFFFPIFSFLCKLDILDFPLYISSFLSNYHLCFLVLISRRLFWICNNFFLFSNGSFFKVSHYCFTEAISSQISLKNINLRGCTLFRLSSLLSLECSVAFWVISLFISCWLSLPLAGFLDVLNHLAIFGCPFILNGDANECTSISIIIPSTSFLLCIQEEGLSSEELCFKVI